MKKFGLIVLSVAMFASCGNKAKDAEQARLDSIRVADSIAAVEVEAAAYAQFVADSIAAAEAEALAVAEAAKTGKKAPAKVDPKKEETKPVVEEVKAPKTIEQKVEDASKKAAKDAKSELFK
ncbi:MAG: hypothetical protein LBT04_03815 [Prevotellaceae bacterium]|jgi:hypothetical protein|nr:hypothetical protein [Prevotellaceae bacterium]